MFEFLRPDKSPQNARMPKRLNTLKRKKRQTTHTPHPHNKKAPRSFANTTIAHSKFLMCIDAKFPPTQQSTPKFHNTLKSKVSDYLKRPSKFRDVYPSPQTDTLQFLNLQNHLSRSQKVTKRHPEFLYTHEIWEFLTIQRPQCTRPNTHTTPPKSFGVSDSLQNSPPFKGIFHTLGVSTDHCSRYRERAVIRLCACRKMPNTLADVNLP